MEMPIDLNKIRQTYPYMDRECALCVWALPAADINSEGEWCGYFSKEVEPRQPACDFFINRYVRYLL